MADTWQSRWSASWAAEAQRYNTFHAPAGSSTGGEFATSSGSGGKSGKGAKPSAHHAGPPKSAASAAAAGRAKVLRARATADRTEAHRLGQQLAVMEKQEKAAQSAARKAAATAKAQTAAAKHHPKASAAVHHAAKARRHHATLRTRISALRDRIDTLLTQARQLDAAASKL